MGQNPDTEKIELNWLPNVDRKPVTVTYNPSQNHVEITNGLIDIEIETATVEAMEYSELKSHLNHLHPDTAETTEYIIKKTQ